MKYHKIPESSIQAELELDSDFLEHSRTYQLFGIVWNNFSQGEGRRFMSKSVHHEKLITVHTAIMRTDRNDA